MHSRIIALETTVSEDEVFEAMLSGVDYVSEMEEDSWDLEILERIGAVDRRAQTFQADPAKVKMALEAMYDEYQGRAIRSFDEYVNSWKAWAARNAIEDKYDIYIFWGYPITWHDFLRQLYSDEETMSRTWKITGFFDYHF